MSKKPMKLKYKKAPCAPKRFKSAFIFFSEFKHKEIRQQVGGKVRAADAAKKVSQAWKSLSQEDRSVWNEHARLDRERFEREKAVYKGPWKIPDTKDSSTPKKPMSAFLAFSNERRRAIGDANPHLTNPDVSALLSQMWKTAPAELKKVYRDREAEERKRFKKAMAEWESRRDKKLYQDAIHRASVGCNRARNTESTNTLEMNMENDSSAIVSVDSSSLSSDGATCLNGFVASLEQLTQARDTTAQQIPIPQYGSFFAGKESIMVLELLNPESVDPISSSTMEELEALSQDMESFLYDSDPSDRSAISPTTSIMAMGDFEIDLEPSWIRAVDTSY